MSDGPTEAMRETLEAAERTTGQERREALHHGGRPMTMSEIAEAEQSSPTPNDKPAVWPLVMVDMASRDQLGRKRYGVPLQPHNGRDTLRDAYEEALDLAVYLRSAIYERDGK